MELKSDFEAFLSEIRLTKNQRACLRDGHARLRKRLREDEDLSPIIVSDFLQGSYRRHTAVRPKNERRPDVDIIVVTNLSEEEYTPRQAMDQFVPFLKRHYREKWRHQGRSFGIELAEVDFDVVITSAPSEVDARVLRSDSVITIEDISRALDWRLHPSWVALDRRALVRDVESRLREAKTQPEWKTRPLRISDREAGTWEDTHPLEQIRWTRDMNSDTGGHFVSVVKSLKWWRLVNYQEPEHPKGFPLERIAGECCPRGISSVAEGLTRTLEMIGSKYRPLYQARQKPRLPDYGVPEHDVLHRLEVDDFLDFYDQASEGANLARRALDSTERTESGNLWRELLGSKFPKPPGKGKSYTSPSEPALPGKGRFA